MRDIDDFRLFKHITYASPGQTRRTASTMALRHDDEPAKPACALRWEKAMLICCEFCLVNPFGTMLIKD